MARVYVSTVLPHTIDQVWHRIRDFNAMPDWHPNILESRIEGDEPADRVGCVRNFVLSPDVRIRERLLALSDRDFSFSYAIIESPVPVKNYVATLALRSVTMGKQTFAEWAAEFECDPNEQEHLTNLVREFVFEAGLGGLVNP